MLEAVGRLYKRSVKLYIYSARDPVTGRVETMDDVKVPAPWHHLHRLLRELGSVALVQRTDEALLSIELDQVLGLIEHNDAS